MHDNVASNSSLNGQSDVENYLRSMSDMNLLNIKKSSRVSDKFQISKLKNLSRMKKVLALLVVAIFIAIFFVIIPVAVVVGKSSQALSQSLSPSIDCPEFQTLNTGGNILVNGTISIVLSTASSSNSSLTPPSMLVTLQYMNTNILVVSTNQSIKWINFNKVNVTLQGTPVGCTLNVGNNSPVIQYGVPSKPSYANINSVPKSLAIVYISPSRISNSLILAQSLRDTAFGANSAFENVNAMFTRYSGGKMSYDGLNNATLPSVYTYTSPDSLYNSCNFQSMHSNANISLFKQSVFLNKFDQTIYVVSTASDCKIPSGMIDGVMNFNENDFKTAKGHVNLASLLLNPTNLGTSGTLSCFNGFSHWTSCDPTTGTDTNDIMGQGFTVPANLQVLSRVQLGWIGQSNIVMITGTITQDITLINADNYGPLDEVIVIYQFFTTFGMRRLLANYTLELQSHKSASGTSQCGVAVRVSSLPNQLKYFLVSLDYNTPSFDDSENGFHVKVDSIGLDCSYATISVRTLKSSPQTVSIVDNRPTLMLYAYFNQDPTPTYIDMYWIRDFYFGQNLTKKSEHVNDIYSRASNNYTQFVGLNSIDVDVNPNWISLRSSQTSNCNYYDWYASSVRGIDVSQYKHVVLNLFNGCGCTYDSFSDVGGKFIVINGLPVNIRAGYDYHDYIIITAYSLGNNLGFFNAGAAVDTSPTDPTRTETSFGDYLDAMVLT